LGILIEDLLKIPLKEKFGVPFVLGMSPGFWDRKNHIKILRQFAKKFANNPSFKLKLHGRGGPFKKEVEREVASMKLSNLEFLNESLSVSKYNSFMEEIDCYVFPSMGEGFSITPREVLALGRPCIVSNNTAH